MKIHLKKINLTFIAFFLVFTIVKAQTNPSGYYTPGGALDSLFDNYGTKFALRDIIIDTTTKIIDGQPYKSANALCTNAGYFNLFFETGCGMDGNTSIEINRRNVICQLMTDLSAFIIPANNTVRVNIWVRNINNIMSNASTNGVLGVATSFYNIPLGAPTFGGISDNEIWKTINSGTDSYTNVTSPLNNNSYSTGSSGSGAYFHGYMAFNFVNPAFANSWHTDLTQATATGYYDLYTIALHEMTHALGFASLINYNGNSKFGASFNYFSRYDLFLKTHSGTQNLISNSGACSLYQFGFNSAIAAGAINTLSPSGISGCGTLPSNSSSDNTVCSTDLLYAGGTYTVPVYTPNCFEPPSSLSHFEDQCYPSTGAYGNNVYFTMSNANSTGINFMKRYLKPEERSVLCDLGYFVKTTFGNAFYTANNFNYGGSSCPGLQVAGIDDGINSSGSYVYTGNIATGISITGVLTNDFPSTGLTFECMQAIIGSGTLSNTSGTSCTYTPTTQGLHLLRYIPVTSGGVRGNITYVYVYVNSANCTSSACDLVNNGGFEHGSNCGQWGYEPVYEPAIDCWSDFCATPDFYVRGCVPASNSNMTIPSTYCSPAANTWDNPSVTNNNAVALWAQYYAPGGYYNSESVQNNLSTPIVAGSSYVLSFVARVQNNFATPSAATLIFGGSPSMLAQVATMGALPASVTPLASAIIPNNNMWNNYSITFTNTTAQNLNALQVINAAWFYGTNISVYVLIDDISIVPVSSAPTFTPPSFMCVGANIPDLSVYATPPGGVFSGNGVTLSGGIYSFTASTSDLGSNMIAYTYTNGLGCVKTVPATIVVSNTVSTVAITPSMTICTVANPITLTASGAASYTWNTGSHASSFTVSPTSTTVYSVSGSGCTGASNASMTVTVISPPSLTITVSPSHTICSGTSVTLTGSGAGSYHWSPSNMLYTSIVVTPTVTSVYGLTGDYPGTIGCPSSITATITVIASPTVSVSPSNTTVCSGTPVTFTASGGTSYLWSTGATTNTISVNPTSTTTYTVTGTSANGCHNSVTATVTRPSISVLASAGYICPGGTSILQASGGTGTYTWSPAGTLSASTGSLVTATPTATTTYSVSSVIGGCTVTNTVIVTITPFPTVTVVALPTPICTGQSSTLTASGATTYSWNTGATTPSITNTINTTGIKTFTVTGTSSYGCSSTITTTINVNATPTISIAASSTTVCPLTSTSLTASGALNYTWTPAASLSCSTCSATIASPFSSTTYSVSGVSSSGCIGAQSILITTLVPSTTISVVASPTAICVNQTATLTASGATTYTWIADPSLSTTTGSVTVATPTTSTIYTVTGVNTGTYTCVGTNTVSLTVSNCTVCPTCTASLTGTITADPTPGSYCINNNITISGTVTLNGEYRIAPNVVITVAPNSSLRIQEAHLYACSGMWQGIVLPSTSSLYTSKHALIEDAYVAITSTTTTQSQMASINITEAIFNKNQVSIQMVSNNTIVPVAGNTYPISISTAVFTSRTFTFTSTSWPYVSTVITASTMPSPLQTPYLNAYSTTTCKNGSYPLHAIELTNVGVTTGAPYTPVYNEVYIGGTTPIWFDNHYYGVYANNSNVTVVNSVFQNSQTTVNHFTHLYGTAVYAYSTDNSIDNYRVQLVPQSGTSNSNAFYNMYTILDMYHYLEANVTYNNCYSTAASYTTGSSTTPYIGQEGFSLFTNRYKNLTVDHNNIYNIAAPIIFWADIGNYYNGITVVSGRFGGQVNFTNNYIRPHVYPNTITNQFVNLAIDAEDFMSTPSLFSNLTVSGSNINISNNSIASVWNGIYTSNFALQPVSTSTNYVSVVDALNLTATPTNQFAINSVNTQTSTVNYNNIVSNVSSSNQSRAITTASNATVSVQCNDETGAWRGIEFNGSQIGTFVGNQLTNNTYGMVLDNSGVIGGQGSNTNPRWNQWMGTWGSSNTSTPYKTYTAGNSSATSSIMWVKGGGTYYPDGNGGNDGSGILGTDNYYFTGTGSGTGTIRHALAGPSSWSCPASVPTCTNCRGAQPAMTSEDSTNAINGKELMEKIVLDAIHYDANDSAINRYLGKMHVYRRLRTDTTAMFGSHILRTYRNMMQNSHVEKLFRIEDAFINGDVVTAQSLSNAFTAANQIETNYLTYYGILANYKQQRMSASDSNNLYVLAKACPYKDGNVVYQARALYNAINTPSIIFTNNCNMATGNRMAATDTETGVNAFDAYIYPNPNAGKELFITPVGLINGSLQIKLTDLEGRIVYENNCAVADGLGNLKITDITNGVYFVHITNIVTGEKVIKKLVIQY